MDLLFLDENFLPCKILDTFKNLAWNRKYYDTGNFQLELLSPEDYKDIKKNNAKYLYYKDFKETAKIETLEYDNSLEEPTIILTGRFLENILEDRVITNTRTYSGTSEKIVRDIVSEFCINNKNPIKNLKLGSFKNLGKETTVQITGMSVKEAVLNILIIDELSYSIDYDFETNELFFNVWQGENRTESSETNSWTIFSKEFENIKSDKYSQDDTKFKNVAYVAGEGEGEERIIVEVNNLSNISSERKELYVDARDLQKGEMSDSEYRQALIQRGLEKLQENNRVETTDFIIDTNSNLVYKEDYDLGFKVTYKNEDLDIYVDNRIVEISEVYENGEKTLNIVFGDDYNIKKVVI